jgi:hypothetical protein
MQESALNPWLPLAIWWWLVGQQVPYVCGSCYESQTLLLFQRWDGIITKGCLPWQEPQSQGIPTACSSGLWCVMLSSTSSNCGSCTYIWFRISKHLADSPSFSVLNNEKLTSWPWQYITQCNDPEWQGLMGGATCTYRCQLTSNTSDLLQNRSVRNYCSILSINRADTGVQWSWHQWFRRLALPQQGLAS